jgi:hypothetical protein
VDDDFNSDSDDDIQIDLDETNGKLDTVLDNPMRYEN